MIGSTIALHDWVDKDGGETEWLPPKPVYDLEFESFKEVEALKTEIESALVFATFKGYPMLRGLLTALGNITPELVVEEGG